MRLLICAGGTGGGVYPALVVLQVLQKGNDNNSFSGRSSIERDAMPSSFDSPDSILWVGIEGGMEGDLIARKNVPFTTIPAAGIHGVGLKVVPKNILRIGRGFFAARKILRQFRPDVMFFTGGFVAVPVALAGFGIPSVLYVPDIEPGLALKVLSRFADRIAVTTEESQRYFKNPMKITVTGYPVRSELNTWHRREACRVLNLNNDLFTLFVMGGSKGARSINQALLSVLPDLLARIQIVHISGSNDWSDVEKAQKVLPPHLASRYRAFPYMHEEIGAAFTIADLALSRAGASTLGEFPLFGLPAILVPYPYAWRYQKVNAEYLVKRGAAILVKDEDLSDQILPLVNELSHDTKRIEKMGKAMRKLVSSQAAKLIAKNIFELATQGSQKRI